MGKGIRAITIEDLGVPSLRDFYPEMIVGRVQNCSREGEKVMKIGASCCLVTSVVLFLFCGNGYPIDDEHSRDSLRGLTGITLVVEPPTKVVEQDGLSIPFIRASAEVKLRGEDTSFLNRGNSQMANRTPLVHQCKRSETGNRRLRLQCIGGVQARGYSGAIPEC